MATSLDLEEQEQIASLKYFWNTWGNWITSLLIVVLLCYAGWNGYQYWQRRQAAYAGAIYDSLQGAILESNKQLTLQAWSTLRDQYGSTAYAGNGALLAGRALIVQGQIEQGKAALAWAASKADLPGQQALARLHLAAQLVGEKSYDAAAQQLSWNFPASFAPLAADRLGDIELIQGKNAQAITQYNKAYEGLPSDSALRNLLEAKLGALGVNPAATPASAAGGA